MITINSYYDALFLINWMDKERIETMRVTQKYVKGDHWQNGDGWAGPPIPSNMPGASETEVQAEKDLAPIPLINEIVSRFVTGLVGREPAFNITLARALEEGEEPTPEEAAELAELNDALTKFWDEKYGQIRLQEFVTRLCSGRATLRFFIPPELNQWNNNPNPELVSQVPEQVLAVPSIQTPKTISEAIENFYLEAPPWERCAVYIDPLSMRRYGIYIYELLTMNPLGQEVITNRAEITEIGQDGKTLFRAFVDETETPAIQYDCNGNVWVFQAWDDSPLIIDPHQKLQRAVDFLNTILPKNAQYAGYRERHFIGIKQNVDKDTGNEVPPQLGPTTVNFWQPVEYEDAQGNMRPAAAHLILGEPVNSQPIRDDIAHMAQMLLRACHQEHVLMSGDSTTSGVSRIQARAEFTDSLLEAKPKVEKVLRDLFMTVLCLGANLMGDTGLLQRLKTDYRIVVNVRENAGPVTQEEQRMVVELYAAGIIPLEIAMTMVDIDDPEAARQMLIKERESSQIYLQNQATLADTWVSAGANLKDAALLAGVDEAEADQLATDFVGGSTNGIRTPSEATKATTTIERI